MSWLDRINNQPLEIVTGDGSVFRPIWKTASKERGLNAARFDFDEVEGTLVKRGKVSGLSIPFELYFQGDDNIEQAEAFDNATKDVRPWTLRHEFYNELLVQPASMKIDNSGLNVSVATGEFWETLPDTFPDSEIDLKESVLGSVDVLAENIADNYADNIGTVKSGSLATINGTVDETSKLYRAAARTSEDLENIEMAISEAYSAIDNITSDANVFMTKIGYLARTPARIYADIKTRISTLQENYQDMKLAITGLTRQNKLFFESFGAMLIGAMAESSVLLSSEIADDQGIENTISDYVTRSEVLEAIDLISSNVNDFFTTLGAFQTVNDSGIESYTPHPDTIIGLKETATKATGRLKQIAVGAKQERTYTLEEDMAIIKLVHKLYGNVDSTTREGFVNANSIKISEVLQVPKGREVTYYI